MILQNNINQINKYLQEKLTVTNILILTCPLNECINFKKSKYNKNYFNTFNAGVATWHAVAVTKNNQR